MGTRFTRKNGSQAIRATGRGAGNGFVELGSPAARAGVAEPVHAPVVPSHLATLQDHPADAFDGVAVEPAPGVGAVSEAELGLLAMRWNATPDMVADAYHDLADEGRDPVTLDALLARVAQQKVVASTPGIVNIDPPGAHADRYTLDADGRPTEVYYASYGSNLYADRFGAYVTGGTPEGSARTYTGCRDTTPPTDDIAVALPGTVHYAGESLVWTGGIAFLDPSARGRSLGRAYRITGQQFADVVAQESNMPVGTADVDTAGLLRDGEIVQPGNYGRLVHVGDHDGVPVVTFTGPFTTRDARRGDLTINPDGHLVPTSSPEAAPVEGKKAPWHVFTAAPSQAYRTMIGNGLAETHKLDDRSIATYLAGSTGNLPGDTKR